MALSQEPVVGGYAGLAQAKDQICFPFTPLDGDGKNVGGEIVRAVGIRKGGKALCDASVIEGAVRYERDETQ